MALLENAAQTAPITGWRLGFESLESELDATDVEVVGDLPADLDGTLYRVGPARHDVYGERYNHWFDGDGMVHALRLGAGRATYRNRFVATAKKQAEDAARRRLFGSFGTPPAGSGLGRARRSLPNSAANTNVVLHAGKLLALWEGGRPWRLDPVTLETLGEDDFGGVLGGRDALSAHPKLDPATGEMWNFGVRRGPKTTLSIYRTTAEGVTTSVSTIPLEPSSMVHDFALTPTKAIVVFPPIALPRIPLGLLSGRKSFGQSLRWEPGRGTKVAVIDRESGESRWFQTDGFMMFHTINAWDEGDDAVVDLCAYPDDTVMRLFTEVMVGRTIPTAVWPERLRLVAATGTVERRRLSDTYLELPRVAGRALSAEHSRIYGVTTHDGGDFIGVPAAVDPESGKAQLGPVTNDHFAGELVPVTKPNATSDDDVWLLTLVLDTETRRSEVWVLDGADVAAPPVAVVKLPHAVPFGFHGNWVRAER